MKLPATPVLLGVGALVALVALAAYVKAKGGVNGAAQAVGAAAVDAAVGVVTGAASAANDAAAGAVGAVGRTVGLPTPSETIDDPVQVRWIIDNMGQLEASKWGTALAYFRAQWLDAGTGTPPPFVFQGWQ